MTSLRFHTFLLLLAPLASAESHMIRVQLEYITTDLTTSQQAARSIAPYPLLLQKLEEGKAERYNTEILTSDNGVTAVAESILQIIYPTEMTGDGLSGSFTAAQNQKMSRFWNSTRLPRPTAFFAWETRNAGFTFEMQGFYLQGQIDLRIAPEDVHLQHMTTLMPYRDPWGTSDLKLPYFAAQQPRSELSFAPSQTLLVATYSPLQDSGIPDPTRPILLFVTASVLTLP